MINDRDLFLWVDPETGEVEHLEKTEFIRKMEEQRMKNQETWKIVEEEGYVD